MENQLTLMEPVPAEPAVRPAPIALRPYQNEAKAAVLEQWEQGVQRTLLVLPTGCGKTIVFAKISEDCVKRGERVLILAHRGELLEH